MPRTLLLIGTRKGAFFLASNDRQTWELHGPYCEGWPVYHVIQDPKSGAVYAAAASEWHGQAVWRSPDLGETWTHSSEGIAYDAESGRKISKVSTLAVSDGRLLVGVEAPGIFESRDDGKTWSTIGLAGVASAITGMAIDPTDHSVLYVGTKSANAYKLTGIRGAASTSTQRRGVARSRG